MSYAYLYSSKSEIIIQIVLLSQKHLPISESKWYRVNVMIWTVHVQNFTLFLRFSMPWILFTASFSAVNIINAYLLECKPVLNYYVAAGEWDYNQL